MHSIQVNLFKYAIGISLILLLTHEVKAQKGDKKFSLFKIEDSSPEFLITFFDDTITGKDIRFVNPIFGEMHFQVDSARHELYEIKFYQSDDGFYANTSEMERRIECEFLERIEVGELNLFRCEVTRMATNSSTGPMGVSYSSFPVKSKYYFFNRGLGDVQPLTRRLLLEEVSESPNAMKYMKRHKVVNGIQIGLLSIPLACAAAGIYNFTSDEENGSVLGWTFVGVGVAALALNLRLGSLVHRSINLKTLRAYNAS